MKKINFLTHINSLKKGEVEKFEDYLNANYNSSTIIIRTYNFYIKYYRKKKNPPDFKESFQEIYGRPFQAKKDLLNLQNGLSDLFLKLKDYLIQEKILETEFEKEFLWLQILEERDLKHQNQLQLQKLKKEKKGIQNIWRPIEKLQVYHYEFFRNDFQKHNPDIDNLHRGLENLEEFYKSIKFKFAAEIINRKSLLPRQVYDQESEGFFLDLEKIDLKSLSKNSELYLSLYKFLSDKNLSEYKELKRFLDENYSKLHQDEKLTTMIYMLNYLAEEIKHGNYEMMEEAFNLYEKGLEGKGLIYKGKLDATPFNNIVATASHLKKFEWAKNFIETYKKYLKEEIRTEVAGIALLMIMFNENKYAEVFTEGKKMKFTNVLFKISSTIYLLASLYELDDHDKIYTPLDTFLRFLNQNKSVGKENKEAALNFAGILRHLIHQRLPKEYLRKEIKSRKGIFFRKWLLDKIENYRQI